MCKFCIDYSCSDCAIEHDFLHDICCLEECGEHEICRDCKNGGNMASRMILNPNEKIVEAIQNRLVITGGYCPCVVERNADTICPCKKFREYQHCCCSLYVEANND